MLNHSTLSLLVAAVATVAIGARASAQTWTGGSAVDSNWTTALNWTALPANNGTANIILAGTTRLTPNVNVAQDVAGITFNSTAGAFNISGGGLTIRSGGITNSSTVNQTITTPMAVAAAQTWNAASGPLTIGSGSPIVLSANLFISGSNNVTFNSGTSGFGILNKSGAGTLTVNFPLNHGGNNAIGGGTLLLGASNVLNDSSPYVLSGTAILNVNGMTETVSQVSSNAATTTILLPTTSSLTVGSLGGDYLFAGALAGDATAFFNKSGSGTVTLSGNSTFPGTITINGGTLNLPSSERLADVCDVTIIGFPSALSLNSGITETIDQLTIGSGGSLGGGASATLNANAFLVSGDTTILPHLSGPGQFVKQNLGTVSLTNTNTYSGGTTINAGTLALSVSNALPDVGPVFVNAGATLQLAVGISDIIGPLSGSGNIVLLGNNTLTTLTVNQNTDTTFDGVMSGNAAANLTKIGSGTLTLAGSNTYRGTTSVAGGTLALAGSDRLAPLSSVVVNGGSLGVGEFNQTITSLSLFSDGAVIGSAVNSGTLTVGALDLRAGTISANLAGTARLIKTTSGTLSTLTLSGNNTYTGGTQLDGGITQISSDANLGRAGDTLALRGGTLRTLSTLTLARPIDIASIGGGTIETLATTTLTGPLSSTSTGALVKSGPGTLILSNSSASCGGILVSAGTTLVTPGISVNNIFSSLVNAGGTLILDNASFAGPSTINQGGRVTLRHGAIHNGLFSNTDGVLAGDGVINGALINAAPADVRVAAGEHMLFAGTAASSNLGLLDVVGGVLEFDAPLTNGASTGLIFARNATLRFNSGLTNQGSIGLSFGVTDLYGDINNSAGATITISGASDATFVDDVINNGVIRTSSGSAAVFFGALSGSGSFPGTGTVFMEGDLRPGNSPGQVEFGGNLVLGGGAALQAELAGDDPSQYDRVTVARTAELDGTLDVRPFNGFSLDGTGIHHFTVVAANAIVGQFAAVQIAPPLASLRIRYTGAAVVLTTCAADFNFDGSLDPDDLADYIGAFFAAPPAAGSDFNNDGATDPDDLADFIGAFFEGC